GIDGDPWLAALRYARTSLAAGRTALIAPRIHGPVETESSVELINAIDMTIGYTLGLDADARERVVVVAKGTFDIRPGGDLRLAREQVPVVYADEFYGDPGHSATRVESDFAPMKLRCDVLVVGDAHAPKGRSIDRVRVGLRLAGVTKSFDVVGDRF